MTPGAAHALVTTSMWFPSTVRGSRSTLVSSEGSSFRATSTATQASHTNGWGLAFPVDLDPLRGEMYLIPGTASDTTRPCGDHCALGGE